MWIGDELGPWLIKADMSGKVLAVFETLIDGKPARSPDHPAITIENYFSFLAAPAGSNVSLAKSTKARVLAGSSLRVGSAT